MKKYLLALALIITLIPQSSLMAQEQQRKWEFGGKINIYSGWNGMIGIGAYGRYDLANMLRLEPSLVIMCEEGSSMDLTVDLHFPLNIQNDVELYPLVGISLNDPGKLGLGFNLGGGIGYSLSERVTADFGMKYLIAGQKNYSNPLIFSIGCGYKF